jgi:hypothetical protein
MRILMVTTVAMAGLAQLSSSWARAAGGAAGGGVWAGYGRWMLMIMVLMMMMVMIVIMRYGRWKFFLCLNRTFQPISRLATILADSR